MRARICILGVAAFCAVTPAYAQDKLRLTWDNTLRSQPTLGATAPRVEAITALSFALDTSTQHSRLTLSGRAEALGFRAATGQTGVTLRLPEFKASYRQATRATTLTATLRLQHSDLRRIVSFVDPITGAALDVEDPGQRLAYRGSVGLSFGQDSPLTGRIKLTHAGRRFRATVSPSYVPSDRTRFEADLTAHISPMLAVTTQLGADRYRSGAGVTRDGIDVSGGITAQLDQITQASAQIGWTRIRQGGTAWAPQSGLTWSADLTRDQKAGSLGLHLARRIRINGAEDSLTLSLERRTRVGTLTARAGLARAPLTGAVPVFDARYRRALPTGRLLVQASRQIRVQDGGSVQAVTDLSARITHQMTRDASVTFSMGVAQVKPLNGGAGDRQRLRLGLGYQMALTPDWRLSTGIDHRITRRGTTTQDTGIFVTLSRDISPTRGQ